GHGLQNPLDLGCDAALGIVDGEHDAQLSGAAHREVSWDERERSGGGCSNSAASLFVRPARPIGCNRGPPATIYARRMVRAGLPYNRTCPPRGVGFRAVAAEILNPPA